MKSKYTFNTMRIAWEDRDHPKLITQHIAFSRNNKQKFYWYRVRRSCMRERWLILLALIIKENVFRKKAKCRNIVKMAKILGLRVKADEE